MKSRTIKEHDSVVLAIDLPKHGLRAGDIGTVVLIHREGAGYEVEFMTLAGETDVDLQFARRFAECLRDLKRLRKCATFRRFEEKRLVVERRKLELVGRRGERNACDGRRPSHRRFYVRYQLQSSIVNYARRARNSWRAAGR